MHPTQSSGGTEAPATFALIIGIDKYKAGSSQFSRLKGAVNDAELFQKFLTDPHNDDGLEVPSSHIVFLANEKATFSAILSNFRSHLLNNPNIPRGAAIIFFFAGHGSRVHDDGNRMAKDGKVEVICPVDERTNVGGNKVPAIPDYVLAHLFKQLSDEKGNNITVILDTCHSGGMARDSENLRVRSPPTPSANIVDEELNTALEKANSACDYSVWSPLSTSHTLLAACGPQSMAFETSSRPHNGLFTTALVNALRHAVRQGTTTYNDLIERLPAFTVAQTPLCIGIHKDRLLFTTNHPVRGIRTLPLTEKEVLILKIGSDDDVDEGNTFIVTASTGRESTFTAPMVTPDRSILASPTPGPFDVLKESHAVIEGDTNMPVEPVRLTQKSTSQA
ncbi:caspase domain-containing protein, partial [Mycena maculata]